MSTEAADTAKPRVLVVDDSRVIRIAARKILKDEFEPLEAGDGEEAWELLNKDQEIALVLSDLSMPYLDGMGLLQRLRGSETERLRNMPIIIVTGAEDDDGAKTRAFAAGATDFITKPFDSVQLLAHTRSHVRLQKTTQELKETTAVLEQNPATDPFTGLGNQRAFLERGQQGLAHAIRHQSELALVLFQVDDFDKIFVQQGKPVGGAILKAVTAALQAEIRREDTAARISMARFGLVTCCADAEGARSLAMRICERVARTPVTDKQGAPLQLSLSASLIAPQVTQETRFESLLAMLVKRLEKAISHGNCIVADDQGDVLPVVTAQDSAPTETPAAPVITANEPSATTAAVPTVTEVTQTEAESTTTEMAPLNVIEALAWLESWNHAGQHGLDQALAQIRAALTVEAETA